MAWIRWQAARAARADGTGWSSGPSRPASGRPRPRVVVNRSDLPRAADAGARRPRAACPPAMNPDRASTSRTARCPGFVFVRWTTACPPAGPPSGGGAHHAERGRAARPGGHPVRRRLRRRHAAHRRPVHLGDRAASATTSRRCRTSRPRSARPPAPCPASRSFQVHFADYDILTPGDAPNVLVAMNPAALKANLADLPARRGHHRQHRRVHQAQPGQGRLRGQPARGRLAGRLRTCTRSALTSHDRRARSPSFDVSQEGRRAGEEHVRARPAVLDVLAAVRVDAARSSSASSPAKPDLVAANIAAFKAGWNFGETTEDFAVALRGQAGQDAAGQLPQHHRQRGARARPGRRRRCGRSCRCSSAPTRSRRPRDILHELSKHKRFGVTHFQAEDEIAGDRRGARRRRTAARSASPRPVRPGRRAQGRDDLPGRRRWSCRWSIVDVQRGGPSTGLPTKTEQADLQHGAVRPQRRGAGRGDRAAVARRTASTPRSRRPGSR